MKIAAYINDYSKYIFHSVSNNLEYQGLSFYKF